MEQGATCSLCYLHEMYSSLLYTADVGLQPTPASMGVGGTGGLFGGLGGLNIGGPPQSSSLANPFGSFTPSGPGSTATTASPVSWSSHLAGRGNASDGGFVSCSLHLEEQGLFLEEVEWSVLFRASLRSPVPSLCLVSHRPLDNHLCLEVLDSTANMCGKLTLLFSNMCSLCFCWKRNHPGRGATFIQCWWNVWDVWWQCCRHSKVWYMSVSIVWYVLLCSTVCSRTEGLSFGSLASQSNIGFTGGLGSRGGSFGNPSM